MLPSMRHLSRVGSKFVYASPRTSRVAFAPFVGPSPSIRAFHSSDIIDYSDDDKPKASDQPIVSKKMGVDSDYFNRPGPWDEKDLGSLLDANKKWSSRMQKQGFFDVSHSRTHAPKILWIGCSDARVPANELIGEPPGNVFVHRNIANQVVNTDVNCMSVIQYAVDVLQVKHIIVCGHYDCGGVKAALLNVDHKPPLENWLRNIRDLIRNYFDELKAITDTEERQRRMVEINVIEQCLNIFKTGVVQKRRVKSYLDSLKPGSKYTFSEPVVHAFVYDPMNGEAKKLKVDFKKYLRSYSDVFNLYSTKSVVESGLHDVADDHEKETILKDMDERKAWNLNDSDRGLDRELLNQIAMQEDNDMTVKEIFEKSLKAEDVDSKK